MIKHSFFYLIIIVLTLTCCQNRVKETKTGQHITTAEEVKIFLQHFIPFNKNFRTDGYHYSVKKQYYSLDTSTPFFSDLDIILKRDFSFLSHSTLGIPDSFCSAASFNCNGAYLCMIRNFAGNGGANQSDWNSSLVIVDSSGVLDLFTYSTMEDPGDTYVRCWIERADSMPSPLVIIGTMQGESDPGRVTTNTYNTYKIENGKFRQVNNIKIDTTAYLFDGI